MFGVFSGLPEFTPGAARIRLMLVLASLGLFAVALSGRFYKVIESPIGKLLTLFTFWFLLCIPLALWRGGSFEVFIDDWSKSFMAFILTAGLISSAGQLRKIFHTIAYGSGVLATLALVFRHYDVEGRLGMPGGRYSGANEFAVTLLFGLIFVGYMYVRGDKLRKAAALVLAVPVLLALSKTGSRGTMLGAGVLFLYLLIFGRGMTRAKLLVAAPIILISLAAMAPESLLERYTTVFRPSGDSTSYTEAEASGSTQARLTLLQDSITITLTHPLVGVGPGNFMVAQQGVALARGEPYGMWHVTHNSYTQVSSEMGIPGLLIYVGFLIQCWFSLSAIIKSRTVTAGVWFMAHTGRAALVVMAAMAGFGSIAYDTGVPILAGLITALGFVAAEQQVLLKKKQSQEAAARAVAAQPVLEPAWVSFPD